MSARLLKKVLKEQERLNPEMKEVEEEEEDHNEFEPPDSGARSFTNPFDILNDGGDFPDSDQDNESVIVGETFTENKDKNSLSVLKTGPHAVSASNHKSKKKKKKRNKEGSLGTYKVEMPLDVSFKTLSLDGITSSHQSSPMKAKLENSQVRGELVKLHTGSTLQVDPKYLNAENELRRIFGSKVVKSFERSNQSGSSRQVRGGRRGSHHIRKTVLVSPSDHWPRWDGSLSMELLETRDGYHYFRYVHSSKYDQAQGAYEAAQAIHDLNGVANVLLYYPYHLDSLITMADYFKFVGEHQMSADATAKCLYALECAWPPTFTPLQGNCQLKFSHDTNKPLFTTLFSHMRNMDRRGCHRSALEVSKLLLLLDPDDPMGAFFAIDYFALRAEEYAWLERFSEDYKSDNSLWLFPNFSYSLAICQFYLEKHGPSQEAHRSSAKATSADLMKQALLLHPTVLKKLVAKVPLKDQAWTNILKHSFFSPDQTGIPSLDHLINIYIERSYLLWRLPELQNFLRDSALLVIKSLEHNRNDAIDWACVRKEAFSSDKNEYAHLFVLNFSDSVPTLPPDNLQNYMVDPRMREAVQNGDQVGDPYDAGHAPPPREVANRNALAVLFESMLPWVNYGDREDEDNEDD